MTDKCYPEGAINLIEVYIDYKKDADLLIVRHQMHAFVEASLLWAVYVLAGFPPEHLDAVLTEIKKKVLELQKEGSQTPPWSGYL